MTVPNTVFTDEEIEFLIEYLEPVLDDEEDGKLAFGCLRKIYNMREIKENYDRFLL